MLITLVGLDTSLLKDVTNCEKLSIHFVPVKLFIAEKNSRLQILSY